MENNFNIYLKKDFINDLQLFKQQIPVDGNPHWDNDIFYIQYFHLSPRYSFLDTIQKSHLPSFLVSLYWTVLIDQTIYTYYNSIYSDFNSIFKYPKFIGNCTSPSIANSECNHHQHPNKILLAINDPVYRGINIEKWPPIESYKEKLRDEINFSNTLSTSVKIIENYIAEIFTNGQFIFFSDNYVSSLWDKIISIHKQTNLNK